MGVPSLTYATMTASPSFLRHVVIFAFKPEATTGEVDTVIQGFGTLKAVIPGIVGYEWGTNGSPEGLNDGFTHCFTLTFASDADRDAYLVHPAHQAFVAVLLPTLARSLVLDYWTQ